MARRMNQDPIRSPGLYVLWALGAILFMLVFVYVILPASQR